MARSTEPRDVNSVHGCRRPNAYCPDCGGRLYGRPELCQPCIDRLSKEAPHAR